MHLVLAHGRALKLLSEDPAHYDDAPREGIRRVLEQVCASPGHKAAVRCLGKDAVAVHGNL